MTVSLLNFFATVPKGIEYLLAKELSNLGAVNISEKLGGVFFNTTLENAYNICLWSRFANRILLLLHQSEAKTPQELYDAVQKVHWPDHFDLDKTFSVHCVCSQSEITHSLFAAQKIKDAIVDQFRSIFNERPSVSKHRPDVAIYAYLFRNVVYLSLDFSGESLHKRGYRIAGGLAPLKENLAAAILTRANWPEIAAKQGSLLDPMCGSGTLLIEAAMIAADIAPQLNRDYMGFFGWKNHDAKTWNQLIEEAKKKRALGLQHLPTIVGYDADSDTIRMAFENIERAQLTGFVHVERRDLSTFSVKPTITPGLVISNPPYGERLSDVESLKELYRLLGSRLKTEFKEWQAAIFTGNPELGKQMGLRAKQHYAFFNGPIPCQLLLFDITENFFVDNSPQAENERRIRQAKKYIADRPLPAALMNRLRKNIKHYKRKAKKEMITADSSSSRNDIERIKVYDCDLPEYKFILEITDMTAYVKEYSAPKTVDPKKILLHRAEFLAVLPDILNISPKDIFYELLILHRQLF